MAQRKPIVLTEDLIKIWSERTGKPEPLLKEMLSLHYKYIDHLIDTKEDCLSIGLPNMGRLKLNYYMSLSYLNYLSPNNRYYDWIVTKVDMLKRIGKDIDFDAINYNRPIFTKQLFKIFGEQSKGAFEKFYTYWNMIENAHNEWYQERIKRK